MITTKKVTFTGSLGHTLSAKLDLNLNKKEGVGVYAPCFTCTKDIVIASRLCAALAEKGIAMLRVDFTGQGHSQGQFSQTNFTTNVNDLLCAIEFLKTQNLAPSLLVGHSLGGTASLVAAHHSPDIKAVVTLNSPSEPLHVSRHFKNFEKDLITKGQIDIDVGGKTHTIQRHFLEDLKRYTMEEILKNLNAAFLIMHAPHDDMVSIQNASDLFTKAMHPKSFISLWECDHLISQKSKAIYIAGLINAWVKAYI